MKTVPDPDKDGALLEAVLRDEQWQAASASARREAVACLQTRRRRRQIGQWACGVVAATCLIACPIWLARPGGKHAPPALANETVPVPEHRSTNLSDGQLLAMFPKGSCVIAEVNGRKELVFLDKEIETKGCVVRWNRDGENAVK
jgi:hypothetical protein